MSVYIVVWCNGNTADFGSAFQGSNPCATTWKHKLIKKGEELNLERLLKSIKTQQLSRFGKE